MKTGDFVTRAVVVFALACVIFGVVFDFFIDPTQQTIIYFKTLDIKWMVGTILALVLLMFAHGFYLSRKG